MTVWKRNGALFLFFLLFATGTLTVCPTIYWRDAPEFVDVVQTYGIPHPAGSPTYILLVKLATFFPIGNLALRVNMGSVVFQALTIGIFFVTCLQLIRFLFPQANPSRVFGAALLASLNFGWSSWFWLTSSFAEVYTMSSAFLIGLIFVALKVREKGDRRFLYLGAFLYGLSSGVHATVIFYLPAILFFFFFSVPKGKRLEKFFWISAFFILGFSTYLYLPLRSLANPPFDWGNPESLSQFLIHVTDRKTQDTHFDFQLRSQFVMGFSRYIDHVIHEIGWIGILPALVGFASHVRKERKFFVFMLLLHMGNLVFFLNWKTGDGFIPSYLVISIWSALGLAQILEKLGNLRLSIAREIRWDRIAGMTLLMFIFMKAFVPGVFPGQPAYFFANRTNFYNAYETARTEYDKMSMDAVAVTTLFWFPFRFFQDVERHREDLSIVMASDVVAPKYFNPMTSGRFPKLHLPALDPFVTPWYEYMPSLINLNISDRDIYYEPSFTLAKPVFKNLTPDLFLFKIVSGERKKGLSEEILDRYESRLNRELNAQTAEGAFDVDFNSREYYMTFLVFSADYFLLHGAKRQAHQVLEVASDLRPHQGTVEYYLAVTELEMGAVYPAIHRLEEVLQRDSAFSNPNFVLAKHALRFGDLEEVKRYLSNTAHHKAIEKRAAFSWVEYFWRSGNVEQARTHLKIAQGLTESDEDENEVEGWRKILDDATVF